MVEQLSVGIPFWILSIVIVLSAFMVVSLRNVFHCAIALIFCLSGVAGIYILLNAEFLAAAQVLIYVGAVSVLMVFAIMLTTNLTSKKLVQTNENAMVALIGCAVFVIMTIVLLYGTTDAHIWHVATKELPADNIMTIGKLLMTHYMLPFEVVSVLLLAAMIGAIVLARRERA